MAESEDSEGTSSSILPVTDDPIFLDSILIHCKWIMLQSTAFINEIGHIKTLKVITRAVDFGILTLKISLNNKNILTYGTPYRNFAKSSL